jgi:hypothetical protein
MTPEQKAIYDKLPEYIMLKAGVDRWRENDEYAIMSGKKLHWLKIDNDSLGEYVDIEYEDIARRPIPSHIREAQAWWILYNQLATVDPYSREGVIFAFIISPNTPNRFFLEVIKSRSLRGIRKFPNEEAAKNAIPILGGEGKISEMFSTGSGVFEKWLELDVI